MARRRCARLGSLLGGCICAALVQAAAASAEAGLVGGWHLDDVINLSDGFSPGTPDFSDSQRTGSMSATQPLPRAAGRFGNAFDISGIRARAVRVPDSPGLEPTRVSLTAWVRAAAPPPAGATVAAKGSTAAPGCGASSYALAHGSLGSQLQFYVRAPSGLAVGSAEIPNAAVWNGAWHAVTGTYDGTAIRVYLDGVAVGAPTPGPAAIAYPAGAGALDDFTIGQYAEPACGGGGPFTGQVDEVRIHDRALTAQQIAYLHAATHAAPPDLDTAPGGGGPGPGAPAPNVTLTAAVTSTRATGGIAARLTPRVVGGAAIARYDYDFVGRDLDTSCNPGAPVLQQSFTRPYSGPVTVTAVDRLGRTASSTTTLAVAALAPPPGLVTARKAVGAAAGRLVDGVRLVGALPAGICTPVPGTQTGDATPNGGPPAQCNTERIAGIVSAIGCLADESAANPMPDAEKRLYRAAGGRTLASELGQGAGVAGRARSAAGEVLLRSGIAKLLLGGVLVSRHPMRINGLDYAPARGAAIVLTGAAISVLRSPPPALLLSSNATVSLNGVVMKRGPLNLNIESDRSPVRVTDFSLTRDVPFAKALTMAKGITTLDLVRRGSRRTSQLATHIGLPEAFGGVTGDATIELSNPEGARLNALNIRLAEFTLAGVGVREASLVYSDDPVRLAGAVDVKVGTAGPAVRAELVLAAPPGSRTLRFQSFFGSYDGPPHIPLGPGVDLVHLDGTFRLYPPVTELEAGVGVTVGGPPPVPCPPYRIDGRVRLHFYPAPFVLRIDGAGRMFCVPVASGYLEVQDTGYVGFGGAFNFNYVVASVSGRLDAAFLFPHFQAEAAIEACIVGFICRGAAGIISDRGMAACIRFKLLVVTVAAGAGTDWPPPKNARVFTGCDFGRYRTVVRPARASAVAERTFHVGTDLRAVSVAVAGAGRAPDVELRGPKGESLVLPAEGPLESGAAAGFRSPVDGHAYFLIGQPSSGTWRVVPRDGSSAVTGVEVAEGLPAPDIDVQAASGAASASGKRVFRYSVAPIAGQRVTFIERAPGGDRVLGIATGRRGILRFTPSDARGTERSIVALVEQDGRPRDNVVVARFTASPPKPGKPAGIRARRRGSSLVVTWSAAARAQRYEARIRLSDGRSLFFARPAPARSFTVWGVAKATRATVRVVGVRGRSRTGPAVVLRVRAAT